MCKEAKFRAFQMLLTKLKVKIKMLLNKLKN